MKKEKVVLAYSGGLDTTAIIPWLKENFDYDVVCCCIDCGQGNELDNLDQRAKLSGASKLYVLDVHDEFAEDADGEVALSLDAQLAAFERRVLEDAIRRHDGSHGAAAKELGISERTMSYRLARTGSELHRARR